MHTHTFSWRWPAYASLLMLDKPEGGLCPLAHKLQALCWRVSDGALCSLPQTAMYSHQRNSKYWPDAEAFLPERFMDTGAAHNPAYAPFGEVRLSIPSY